MSTLIADDCKTDRAWLAGVIKERFPHLQPIHEAANGREAIELCIDHGPSIVILDFRMPEVDGVGAAEAIFHRFPNTAIVMFSSETENCRVLRLAQRMSDQHNDAFVFVPKTATQTEMARAIEQVIQQRGNPI